MELRLGPEGLCGRSADRKNCELFGATARGQPVQRTLDMAMAPWGSGVLGARRDGSSPHLFCSLDACGYQVAVERKCRGFG